jgi:hypothetical protein
MSAPAHAPPPDTTHLTSPLRLSDPTELESR